MPNLRPGAGGPGPWDAHCAGAIERQAAWEGRLRTGMEPGSDAPGPGQSLDSCPGAFTSPRWWTTRCG